jgi:hypothetical protein
MKKKPAKRKNKQDLTLRNLRAATKREAIRRVSLKTELDQIYYRMNDVENIYIKTFHDFEQRISALEKKKGQK